MNRRPSPAVPRLALVAALSAAAIAGTVATAGADPLVTDRPGNGNAASVVGRYRLQLETSLAYADTRISALSLPTALRLGLGRQVELRAFSSIIGLVFDPAPGARDAMPTDTGVGAKLALSAGDGLIPQSAVMADVFLPTGDDVFTADAVVVDARLASAWSLPSGFSLLLNVGIDTPTSGSGAGDDRYVRLGYVANLGYGPPIADGRLSLFIESFGRISTDRDQPDIVQIDAGVAYLLSDDTQLDVFTQHGVSDAATDFQIAIGVSRRFALRGAAE